MRPVVRKLVNEHRPVSKALDVGPFEILLAKRAELTGTHGRKAFGIMARIALVLSLVQAPSQRRDVR